MESVALFGGSFDPPHIGHVQIVKEALKVKEIEKVVIMPTFLNPFKSKFFAPATLRLKWLKEIFFFNKHVEIDSFEVDLNKKISSIQSVKYLLKRYEKIYLIIGADNLKTLSKWDKYSELKTLVTFIIATRDEIRIPKEFIKLHIDEDISSTILRENIDTNKLSEICSDEIMKFYKENNAK